MAIINIMNLNWKEIASGMFQVHKAVSASFHQMISLDCLIKGELLNIIKLFNFYIDKTESFYIEITSIVVYPLAYSFFLLIYWFMDRFLKKYSFSLMMEKFLITVCILMAFFLSPIINAISNFFNCTTLYSNQYITQNLFEKCHDNPRYSSWRTYVMLPSFLFYAVVLPLLLFLFLFKNRKILHEEKMLSKIGFLLKGYSENRFYW